MYEIYRAISLLVTGLHSLYNNVRVYQKRFKHKR